MREKANRYVCLSIAIACIWSIVGESTHASPATWFYAPSKVGRALHEGGWTVEYALGQVNASPEFTFPLQLIYQNNREQQGMFGSQWWCPQLESTVLPRGRGIIVWTMPSGGMIGFREDARRTSHYQSFDNNWRAKVTANRQTIFNAEGWEYHYSRGRLESVTSPTGRILELVWSGERFQGMQLRDSASGALLVLMKAAYGDHRRLAALEIGVQQHGFNYVKDGSEHRLAVWNPPLGRPVSFLYHAEAKVLVHAVLRDGKDRADVAEFRTEFVRPYDGDKPKNEPNAKRNPANWWLVADRDFDYTYARDKKKRDKWNSEKISITGRTGIRQEIDFATKRGILTARPDTGPERKTYYYRAPGQRYDGKLRRIEEGGKLLVEYRYDRRTGLMSEMHDANGVVTFFDYDPNWRPARRQLWEPKPVRIRRGTRRAWEVVGEFAYDDNGRLLAAKDIAGQITRYTYTNRGELASIADPMGGITSFTYDQLGRYTSITRNGLKESVEYDQLGRVRTQVAADGIRTEFVFDKQGQIEQIKRDGETAIEYVRNELGQLVGEKDPLGRMRRIERDARGNLIAEHAPNGSVTRYEYDEFNRRVAQIDGNGNKITFAYDAMGRLVKQVNPLGGTLTWKYDDKGRLVERTNGEQAIRQTYNSDGKISAIDYGNGQRIEYTHDKEGRVRTATTPDTAFEYVYDKLGKVEATVVRHGEEEQLIRYTHNARGQRTALVLSRLIPAVPSKSGRAGKTARYEILQQTHYAYDSAGRLLSIVTNGLPAIYYRYDETGRVVRKFYGSDKPETAAVISNIGYDAHSRLAKVQFSGTRIGSPLLLAYEWDSASQLARRSWNGEIQRYEYDPGGQLLKVIDDQSGRILEDYRYDAAGNMLEKVIDGQRTAMVYNAANQLVKMYDLPSAAADAEQQGSDAIKNWEALAREVLTYSYDKAGRLLGTENQNRSQYGWLDKVTEMIQPDGSKITFSYWPDGQIAAKTSTKSQPENTRQTSERFLWDGLALLKRNNTVYIIEPHPSGGVPIASHPVGRPDQITWHLNDLLGTTLATVEKGSVQFTKLTAFGQPLKFAANLPSAAPVKTDAPELPNVPLTDSIQHTNINP